jgi:hypothetical protein
LRQLPHIQLHIVCENHVFNPLILEPAPNLVSLSLDHAMIQDRGALCRLLRESRQLKILHFIGNIDILSKAGQLPPLQELIVRSKWHTECPNPPLWDFSKVRYLQIGLPDIRPVIEEAPLDMPSIRKLTLFYMARYSRQNEWEWENGAYIWLNAVERFLEDRTMCQLKDLSISGIRPLRLARTLATAAPALKRLWLNDVAPPPTLLPNYTTGNIQVLLQSCPGLESLYISLPHSVLDPDNEVYISLSYDSRC